MKRSNTINTLGQDNLEDLKQKIVYHEAGHATGIHFNSIQKKLPPIFFQIIFTETDGSSVNDLPTLFFNPYTCVAKIEGGRLIESLPLLTFKAFDAQSSIDIGKRAFEYTDDYCLGMPLLSKYLLRQDGNIPPFQNC